EDAMARDDRLVPRRPPSAAEEGPQVGRDTSPGVSPGQHALRTQGLAGWLERHGVRTEAGRRSALAIGVAALAAVLAGWWLLAGRQHAGTEPGSQGRPPCAPAPAPAPPAPAR